MEKYRHEKMFEIKFIFKKCFNISLNYMYIRLNPPNEASPFLHAALHLHQSD